MYITMWNDLKLRVKYEIFAWNIVYKGKILVVEYKCSIKNSIGGMST